MIIQRLPLSFIYLWKAVTIQRLDTHKKGQDSQLFEELFLAFIYFWKVTSIQRLHISFHILMKGRYHLKCDITWHQVERSNHSYKEPFDLIESSSNPKIIIFLWHYTCISMYSYNRLKILGITFIHSRKEAMFWELMALTSLINMKICVFLEICRWKFSPFSSCKCTF